MVPKADKRHRTARGNRMDQRRKRRRVRPSVQELADTLQRNYLLVLVSVGYLLALFPFNWSLSVASHQTMLQRPFEANAIVDMGEAVGFLIAMTIALTKKHLNPPPPVLVLPFALAALGSCLIAICDMHSSLALALAGDAALGCGYAVMFVLWLDVAAKLPPKKMLVAIAVGYSFNFVSYPIILDVRIGVGAAYAVAAAAASALLLLIVCQSLLPAGKLPRKVDMQISSRQPAYLPPARLIAFSMVIPFAYGFCTSYLGVGVSSLGLKIGFALPAVIILAGLLLFWDSFNLSSVYWVTCPLMIVGLLSSFFLELQPTLSKSLITAALSSVHFVVFMVVRVQSQEQGRSPAFAFALLNLLMMTCTKTSKEVEALFAGTGWDSYLIVLLVTAVALSYGLLVAGSYGKAPFDIRTVLSVEAEHDHVMHLAQDLGLSKRDTSVDALLLEDKTNADIAEQLFIAPSTVRAHISRIYEKFDVHTRQEFVHKTRG